MELSQKLKELRKKQGLTQLELAERLFVSRQAISGWEAGTSRPSTENLQSLSRLFNIPLETLLDDTAEAEPAAAPEKLPAEEQAKEEGKGQGLGKDRRYKAIVMVIVLLAILLTTAVLAHRRTAQEKTGVMTFSEMECEDIDLAGAKSVPIEGFEEMSKTGRRSSPQTGKRESKELGASQGRKSRSAVDPAPEKGMEQVDQAERRSCLAER